MQYIKAAETNEIGDGEKKKVEVQGKEILLSSFDGKYYALDNKCPHMGGSLYDGELDGYNIVCPRHGSTFDIRDGKLTDAGKIIFIKLKVDDAHAYPVKVEGTDILIGIE